jgi:hypothetical protein
VVPVALAVIAIFLLAPDVEKLNPEAKPTPAAPCPVIDVVAVMLPVVVNAAPTLIPLPPVVPLLPPWQFVKTTSPLLVKVVPKATPWQLVPVPPVQPVTVIVPSVIVPPKVTVPVVPVVQPLLITTP